MNRLRRQNGVSLVELMVGMAIGLIVVAAAMMSLSQHLRESRSLLLDARLMQDLRTASDLMARDLRRAGYWREAASGVWQASAASVQTNPHTDLVINDITRLSYSRDTSGSTTDESLAYRLRQGVIEMQWAQGSWQAMTDANTMFVSTLTVTPRVQEIALADFCSRACTPGDAACPPRQQIRSVALQIVARSTTDAAVVRNVQTEVRLRNDALVGACPA